jgi:hypothetical protein
MISKSPESIRKEIPQKSKSLKLHSLPPQILCFSHLTQTHIQETNCLIVNIEVEVCETGPPELPDLFTIQLLTNHLHRNQSSLSSAKGDAEHRLLEGSANAS